MKNALARLMASAVLAGAAIVAPPERPLAHPKLRGAVTALQAAREELQHTDNDFGGHKKDALDSIDHALKEIRLAIQFEKY